MSWLIYTVFSLQHSQQVIRTVSIPSWIPDMGSASPREPLWLPFFSLQRCFFGKLLVGSSQFDRLSWLPRAFYPLHCSSCKSLVLSCSGSGDFTLSFTLQTGSSFSDCCDVNHIFSLKPWLSRVTCSPAVRPLQVTSLNESMNFLNSASLKMSSYSLLSSFHLWDFSCLRDFSLLYKDRAKGEWGVTQTSFCSKWKHRLACLAVESMCLCRPWAFSVPWSASATLLQVCFIWRLSMFPAGRKSVTFYLHF